MTRLLESLWHSVNRARRALYRRGVLKAKRLPKPVISIGNIAAGGAGKTPCVIAVAKHLGSLSLAMRSAVELRDTADSRTISSCDVSPEIARQNALAGQSVPVVVYGGGKVQEYSVRKQDSSVGCDASPKIAGESGTVVVHAADEVEAVKPPGKR